MFGNPAGEAATCCRGEELVGETCDDRSPDRSALGGPLRFTRRMLLTKISRRLSVEYTMPTALPRYCWAITVVRGSRM